MEKRGKGLTKQEDMITSVEEFFAQYPEPRLHQLLGDAKEYTTGMGIGYNLDEEIVYVNIDVVGSKASEMGWYDNDKFDFASLDIDGVELEEEEEEEVYRPTMTLQVPFTREDVEQSMEKLRADVEQYYKELNDKQ